jgi:polyhydroxybutyrate depolymerase
MRIAAAVLAALAAACGSPDEPRPTAFGGERPVELRVPDQYDHDVATPLLLVLHGYGINGAVELGYMRLDRLLDDPGVLLLAPDGTLDQEGSLFWNTEHAGCAIGGSGPLPDDVGYLVGLLDEVSAVWNVDPDRVYVFGHSNGGFMAHRLACDHADRIAAIISLAGAPALEEADCAPSEAVSVLQLHGDADDTVSYVGGDEIIDVACPYPGAEETAARWARHDGCSDTLEDSGERLNLVSALEGDETRVERHPGCGSGVGVELWTIVGGGHIPAFRNDVYVPLWGFLDAHPKG